MSTPSDTPEIQPALTKEEWWEYLNSGRRSPTAEDEFEENREAWGKTAEEMRRTYHKNAARALYQAGPLGFTWEDVDDENQAYHDAVVMARWAQEEGDEERCQQFQGRARRHRLRAMKIAALLPPREETP